MNQNKKYMAEANAAVRSGRWMIRTDDNGKAHGGFQWQPQGKWTTAPDWSDRPTCGGGLHGQARQASGYNDSASRFGKPPGAGQYTRLVFCKTKGQRVKIENNGDKIKVPAAKILLVNELPSDLKFDGDLDLAGSGIKKIGSGLSIGGSLDLGGTQITALPEGLSVGDYLYLRDTQITSLPKGLSVGGSLDLGGTQIEFLPEGLSIGGCLNLGGTQITALPEGLSVGSYLYLDGSRITSLPKGLSVGGDLYLRGTQIESLPEGLSVGCYLYLRGSRVTSADVPKKLRERCVW